jgi:transposase-like protein
MDPQTAFCPNLACNAHGEVGSNTIRVHSWTERRYLCTAGGRTFAVTTGTPLQRPRTEVVLVLVVLRWLSWGCPIQAAVQTFALHERTAGARLQRAGPHCQQVRPHRALLHQVDLQHV